MPRVERDSIGEVTLKDDVLYGINTFRAAGNFAISGRCLFDEPHYIEMLATVKLAALQANEALGVMCPKKAAHIKQALSEIQEGQHHQYFIVDLLEGSGGTSTNMNMNEVASNRSLQLMGHELGDYEVIHPNNHLNMSQSTNDVIPTAIKLATYNLGLDLVAALDTLTQTLEGKAREHAQSYRVGRTCGQAAQPMTLGQAFGGYASAFQRSVAHIESALLGLRVLPLGGTAIGTGLGAPHGFAGLAVDELSAITGYDLQCPQDMFDAIQNLDAFSRLSNAIRTATSLLGKIANDLIFLASDPETGVGEVQLPKVQAGSSLMPGKVNPVIPMLMQQADIQIQGHDHVITTACAGGFLEINHFEPLVATACFDMIRLCKNAAMAFKSQCLSGLQANEPKARQEVQNAPVLGSGLIISTKGRLQRCKLQRRKYARSGHIGLRCGANPSIFRTCFRSYGVVYTGFCHRGSDVCGFSWEECMA